MPSELSKLKPYDPEKHCGNPDAGSAYRTTLARIERFTKVRDKHDPQSAEWHEKNRAIEGMRIVAEKYASDSKPCIQPKGAKTNHLGRGLCWQHCDCKGLKSGHSAEKRLGFYADLKDPELLRKVGEMVVEGKDPRDLEPDILVLRAMLRDAINEQDTDKSIRLLDLIGKMIERENNLKLKQAVSWDAVTIMMERMAAVVKNVVTDPEMLNAIMAGWSAIQPVESDAKLQVVEN